MCCIFYDYILLLCVDEFALSQAFGTSAHTVADDMPRRKCFESTCVVMVIIAPMPDFNCRQNLHCTDNMCREGEFRIQVEDVSK